MQALTEAVLSFAKGAGGESKRNIDLSALVESLCADLDDLGEPVTWHAHKPAPLACRPDEIRRAVRNLVENAVAYGRRADVQINETPASYEIVVEDEGPGIPDGEQDRVFEPFVRLESSRNSETGGTGLGLTLVKAIAQGHGGGVTLENRPEGGLRARLSLPREVRGRVISYRAWNSTSCPVAEALGAILAHGVRAGGQRLQERAACCRMPIVAGICAPASPPSWWRGLNRGDVGEDEAAARIAVLCGGAEVRTGAAFTGRVNLYALNDGLALIDAATVDALNAIDEAITIATVSPYARVGRGQMVATIKIIPFAAPRTCRRGGRARCCTRAPRPRRTVSRRMRAALISTALPDTKPSLLDKNRSALEDRLTSLGSTIVFERNACRMRPAALAAAIGEAAAVGADPILVFGASAITDRRDVIPAAITAAGGEIVHFGMPVDPGNLLLLGRLGDRTVIGLPSCARSPKLNGFDFVLWRLLAGLPVGRAEIAAMGVGGLLGEIPTRPQPRDERPAEAPHLPRIGAIVLAAGLSSRMGSNKLLERSARQAAGAPRRRGGARQRGLAGHCCHRQRRRRGRSCAPRNAVYHVRRIILTFQRV